MSENPKGRGGLIEFFADALYRHAIDPGSDLYLPKLIQGQTNPAYEPYLAGAWKPGNIDPAGEGAVEICAGVTDEETLIPTPGAATSLDFTNVTITGISNVVPGVPTVAEDTVTLTATFSKLPEHLAPTPLTVKGDFTLTQACCPTDDQRTCSAPSQSFEGKGTFEVKVAESTVAAAVLLAPSPDGKTLTATVQSLKFATSSDESNLQVLVDITSIPSTKWRAIWSKTTETIINSPEGRQAMVDNLVTVLGSQATLDSLSALISNALKSLVKAAAD